MADPKKKQPALRDVDRRDVNLLAQRAQFAFVAGVLGGLIGYIAVGNWLGVIAGALLGMVASWKYIDLWGDFAGKLYSPSGRSTPYRHQHSQALALVAQGKYEAAIAEFERDIAAEPRKSEPYLHIARLHRDKLGNFDESIAWFRRARAAGALSPAEDQLVSREIVEIWTARLKQPARAIPELARLAETAAGTPNGEWARAELAALRATLSS